MNIEEQLRQLSERETDMHFNNVEVNPEIIRAIMINEVVPSCPEDDFYGKPDAAYMSTTIPLFRKAEIEVNSALDILNKGIYITSAVKMPKTEYTVSKESIEEKSALSGKRTCIVSQCQGYYAYGGCGKESL